MKMLFYSMAAILVGASSIAATTCTKKCQEEYTQCKAKVQKKGGLSYFSCLNAEKKCENFCKRK